MSALASRSDIGVLVVAENISLRLSGETILPFHYLSGFQRNGFRARGICHARVRDELRADLPADLFASIDFVEDSWAQKLLFRIGRLFPYRIEDLIFNQIIHVLTQLRLRRVLARIVADHAIDIIHEPAPIAPKALSFVYGVGVPVVIGPMSGGMELPPAFRRLDGPLVRCAIRAGRVAAGLLHRAAPGKLRADVLIVGNDRTRRALPAGVRGQVVEVTESGVDFEQWPPKHYDAPAHDGIISFLFCSRFVDWKGIRYLVEAFAPLARAGGVRLDLVGDGELYPAIARQIADAGLGASIILHGRLSFNDYLARLRSADVYVTPSLRECGGMAMMEAMAIGLPVVALRWGGAAQYANDDCALFVEPTSEAAMVDGLTAAMRRLAWSPALRETMGRAARQRIIDGEFGWNAKVGKVAAILSDVVDRRRAAAPIVRERDVHSSPILLPQPEAAG